MIEPNAVKSLGWYRREANIFFNGWVFFTRFPAPHWVEFNNSNLGESARYLSLIGLVMGAVAAATFAVAGLVFPASIAVLLSMLATVMLTGGFHEDGLADTCDGFGGGWAKADVLRIMKDSRLGSYGALGLVFILAGKYLSLVGQSGSPHFWLILVAGHSLSRFSAVALIACLPYVQDPDKSKSKPMARGISRRSLGAGAAFASLPLFMLAAFLEPVLVLLAMLLVLAATWWLGRYFRRRIGGYTGDCLGAVQQVTETVFYLALLVQL